MCGYCGEAFSLSPSHKYQFCSLACRQAACRVARTRYCVFCTSVFEAPPHRAWKFCSKGCEAAARAVTNRAGAQEPPPVDGARWIALSVGDFALVDARDYPRLVEHVWWKHITGYPTTKIAGRQVKMHQLIMGPLPVGKVADHVNRHRLDNRRGNLRVVDHSDNAMNRRAQTNNTSGYKGVGRLGDKWVARIGVRGERRHLGSFSSAEEAARAYDTAARNFYGTVATLNFPDAEELQDARKA